MSDAPEPRRPSAATPNCCRVCKAKRFADSSLRSAITSSEAPFPRAFIRLFVKSARLDSTAVFVPNSCAACRTVASAESIASIA